jgi:hypothetical protein
MERELEASRSQHGRNPIPKLKSQKSDYPVWDIGVSDFFRTDRDRLEFEI